MIYSLDEKVVGSWVDGKPLYQKTMKLENPVSGYNIIDDSADIESVIYAEAYANIYDSELGLDINEPFTSDGGYSSQSKMHFLFTQGGDGLELELGSSIDVDYFYVTYRYTKTTDTTE